ncbi:MAG: GNAT family N-acetyltransferase [Ruminiclostridium sp.]|nr:GNAT family N-acetyltransferase [Ruminiclostridium sp.]
MEILELNTISEQKAWAERIRLCDWGAAKLLADLVEQNKFNELLGDGSLYIMADGKKIASFCTLTQRDCIKDDTLFPWIGFVFTAPEYRGNRYSGQLIEFVCNKAKEQGYKKVYIATDHIGLYEKYGFTYIESRTDIYGEEARIYYRIIGE